MGLKSFLMFLVMLSAMRLGPTAYKDLTCVEPVHGYAQRVVHFFTASEIEKVCPTHLDVACQIGNDALCTLFSKLLTLLVVHMSWIGNTLTKKWSSMVSKAQEWKNRRPLCGYCGTAPCQVLRRSKWHPSGPRERDEANFSERSNAMMLFNCGLEVSTILTKELPQDELYWTRRSCQKFEEEQLSLFPLCIQRQIDLWYPVPR
ncbi:uncharacterized protein LOC110447961 [Mizuhopecten yessoensis]|uniref:uncharacterized protein LOC110447961 n=1 Tax=Mizuhopecten yessoensis TaxID=6573 RepID=UPI000B458C3E|nr:uncharacterized protein LOC110447961 [Mizuhopecten yessoensis]